MKKADAKAQMDMFSVARARATDPATSHEAAARTRDLSGTKQGILYFLGRRPMIDEELEAAYLAGWERFGFPLATRQSIRSRRNELVKLGLVEAAGELGMTSNGGNSMVWRVVRT